MRRIAAKLAPWHELCNKLEAARLRLTEAGDGPGRQELEAQVRRLTEPGRQKVTLSQSWKQLAVVMRAGIAMAR